LRGTGARVRQGGAGHGACYACAVTRGASERRRGESEVTGEAEGSRSGALRSWRRGASAVRGRSGLKRVSGAAVFSQAFRLYSLVAACKCCPRG